MGKTRHIARVTLPVLAGAKTSDARPGVPPSLPAAFLLHRQTALPRVGTMGQHIVNQQVGDHAAADSIGARLGARMLLDMTHKPHQQSRGRIG